ncbi:DUF397 domain-containing protein [Streptomyces corynorhini]|uniref:DUF397 domain-containing protein n=1 Tax=Streptomyces corynorhini TaxID=2282652 RepID=A0A370AYF5_9ACTN|nr:DUF397 domain-containing protein [Streptomyces corynorhini]RDG34610.1 DUF397 domain-containing protein [Streptomyces corynorhini]
MRHAPELSNAHWRKSSYSNTNGGSCVEITEDFPGVVPVRDTKNPTGPTLTLPTAAWATFIATLRT